MILIADCDSAADEALRALVQLIAPLFHCHQCGSLGIERATECGCLAEHPHSADSSAEPSAMPTLIAPYHLHVGTC